MSCLGLRLGSRSSSVELSRATALPNFIRVHKHNQKLQDDAADVSLAERPWPQEQNACVYTHGVKSAVGERGRCIAAQSAIHH